MDDEAMKPLIEEAMDQLIPRHGHPVRDADFFDFGQ